MDAVILSRMNEVTKSLKELKSENSNLKEEVQDMKFQIELINVKILEMQKTIEEIKTTKVPFNPNDECPDECPEDQLNEFEVVQIRRKTMEEERNWMKEKLDEMKKKKRIEEGESLEGKTVGQISESIPLPNKYTACCVIKLANFLSSDLSSPQYYFWRDSRKISGPSRVGAKKQEVFSFLGGYGCSFLYSFEVNPNLRLAIRCWNNYDGDIDFGIGFTPADVPTDRTLYNRLNYMPEAPDFCSNKGFSKVPQEFFISHGNLLVRGHMTCGVRSIVHVEILEIKPENQSALSGIEIKKVIVDGKSIKSNATFQNSGRISKVPENYGRFSCIVEIANCLNVNLTNRGKFYFKCDKNDSIPSEVLSFHREIFFGADKESVQVMFAYQIESTEFAILVALKVQRNLNCFAAAFVQIEESATGKYELHALMDPNGWKIHNHRKYANASDGPKIITISNIRAQLQMSEEEQAGFKIRIFAI